MSADTMRSLFANTAATRRTRNATIQAKIAPPWRVPWMRTVIPTPEKHARKGRGGSPGMRRESRLKRARGGRMIEGSWRELEEEE